MGANRRVTVDVEIEESGRTQTGGRRGRPRLKWENCVKRDLAGVER